MVVMLLLSPAAFRAAFYETFLHIHIALVSLALAALWIHLDGLLQQVYLKVVIAVWVVEVSQSTRRRPIADPNINALPARSSPRLPHLPQPRSHQHPRRSRSPPRRRHAHNAPSRPPHHLQTRPTHLPNPPLSRPLDQPPILPRLVRNHHLPHLLRPRKRHQNPPTNLRCSRPPPNNCLPNHPPPQRLHKPPIQKMRNFTQRARLPPRPN